MMIVTASKSSAKFGLVLLITAFALSAQTTQIQARLGNGDGNNGKCTIEVEVDDVAEVEVSRSDAQLRTLSGSAANFRRMDCTGPLPANPVDFRFEGVDGRGSQQLIRDPREGRGVAVVRIDDRASGREGYTFDLIWSNAGGTGRTGNFPVGGPNNGGFNGTMRNGNNGNGRGNGGNWNNGNRANGGFNNQAGATQAMRACQAEVVNRIRRGGYSDIQFLRADFDNNRNRTDRITGTARAMQTFGADQFEFSCRVDLNSGRLDDVRVERGDSVRRR